MASRVYLVPGKSNAILWDLSIPLTLANSKIITPQNTLSITRYDNGIPVVYQVGAASNPPNFTQIVKNIVYFIEVKTPYWLNNAIATTAIQPQPLHQNLTNISELATTAFGLGFLVLQAAQEAREKIGAVSTEEFGAAIVELAGSKQPVSEELSAIALLKSTEFGRQLLTLLDGASLRSQIGAVSVEELENYARLTGDGTLPTSVLPNEFLASVTSVSSVQEMLALTDVQPGDSVIRRDLSTNKLFTLLTLPASDLGNWQQAAIGIQTLNGQSGPIVNLGAGDIGAEPAGSSLLVAQQLTQHQSDSSNPHGVTAEQVGAEVAGAAAAVGQALIRHESDRSNPHRVTVDQVGGQARSARLDSIVSAGAGIFKVQPDTSLIQVESTPIGELILNAGIAEVQSLTEDSIIAPSASAIPVMLAANTILKTPIPKLFAGKPVLDGQQLTIINASNHWLFVPSTGGIKAVPPKDNLMFTYSALLGGWTAPATLKTLTCRVFHTVDQVIPFGASLMTPVMFDSTRWDTSGGVMKDKVNNNRLIAPVSGYYTFNGHFQIGATGFVAAFLRMNGTIIAPAYINGNPYLSFPGSYFVPVGSFIDVALRVYSATLTATLARVASFSPEFEMRLYSLPQPA